MRFLWRWTAALAALVVCAGVLRGQNAKLTDYQVSMRVAVPMRDGVQLNATLFKPVPLNGKMPTIVMLSPYAGDNAHPSGAYFAQRGYVYAFVDTRGRGDSGGVFHPFNDAEDGHDVVEWMAAQPWSDGKVAMFGGSYAGGDQWQTASTHPPHLAALAPVASVRPSYDFPSNGNIFFAYDLQWLAFTSGRALYENIFSDGALWSSAMRRMFADKAPFAALATYTGITDTDFSLWLSHPERDNFWKTKALLPEQVAAITLPMLVLTGARDGDQGGTLAFYDDHQAAPADALGRYFLVIGPWDHSGTREPKADVGGRHHGSGSLIDVLRLHKEFYDWTLKGGARPAFLKDNVAYFVSGPGAECWKYAHSLASVAKSSETLYLDASGGGHSLYQSGLLTSSPPAKAADAVFVSDPNDLSDDGSPTGDDQLLFHSAAFESEREIAGRVDIDLWLAMDTPDADIGTTLFAVMPDGSSHVLDNSTMRARYRHSLEKAELVPAGVPQEYRMRATYWFAERMPRGARLRLLVSGLNSPDTQKNWNAAKPVNEQRSSDAQIAHIRLLQDAQHRSRIVLPLADPAAACTASAAW